MPACLLGAVFRFVIAALRDPKGSGYMDRNSEAISRCMALSIYSRGNTRASTADHFSLALVKNCSEKTHLSLKKQPTQIA
jgi:hypothetical protein